MKQMISRVFEGKMRFSFCASKEDNKIEEDDERWGLGSVIEAEEEMTFPFYASKEDNEVEEDDERIFLKSMRSPSINEGEDEKLYVLER